MNTGKDRSVTENGALWAPWLAYFNVVHAWQTECCRLWARNCLPSFFAPHPHEGHHQLEIPDPLAEAKEPELFA